MTSALAIKQPTEMTEAEILKYLQEAAKETNLPDTDSLRPPKLQLNYAKNLPGIPLGSWVFGQKKNEEGKISEAGIGLKNPTIAILAVRYQYTHYFQNTKKTFRSPMFKQFKENTTEQYKEALAKEVYEKTRQQITKKDITTKQLVYALVNIEGDWKLCFIPNFHGTNYMQLQDHIRTFKGLPYNAFPTYLPNTTVETNGATEYYKMEKLTSGDAMFSVGFLYETTEAAKKLNRALDDNATIDVAAEEPPTPQSSYSPPTNNQNNDIPAKKIEAIMRLAEESGLADMDDFKKFVKEKTGLTTIQGLSDENYIILRDALEEYKAQPIGAGVGSAFNDIPDDEIPF